MRKCVTCSKDPSGLKGVYGASNQTFTCHLKKNIAITVLIMERNS